jgi:uncharacterized protein YabE (DUF348 family)
LATEGLTAERLTWTAPRWLQGPLGLALAASAIVLLILGLGRTRSALVLNVDGQSFQVRTHAMTVAAALQQAGLQVYPEDRVSPGLDASVAPGLVIHIQRAHPVTLSADGRTRPIRTHAGTIGELLSEVGLPARPGDETWLNGNLVGLETPLGQQPEVLLRRASALILADGGAKETVHTTAATVGQLLETLKVTVYLADQVTPGLQERIQPGMTITIERSLPLQLEVDGRTIRTRTLADTVAGVLGQEGIALVGSDTVVPDLSAPIRPAMTVRVTRVRKELEVEFETIPFLTVWVADPDLELDTRGQAQAGEPGLTKRRYRVRYENGREVERVMEDSWTEQQPITKTLTYGTKLVVRTLETADGQIEYWRKMRVYTTAYTAATCGKPRTHPRYGYTRLGWWLTKGVVAVDPTVIPLKTRLYVPGYGLARAGDTGGGVIGKFVDLGFDEWNYESWHWWTDVYLLTPVPPRSEIRWILPDWPRYPDRRR